MPILYIDNYRGFNNTFIPLKDVNFFVGENSTGKTSILSIIQILNSSEFWLAGSFNTLEINMGSFDEMVNKEQKSFTVGFYGENPKLFPNIGEAVCLSITNHEGLPIISDISYIFNNNTIKILFKDGLKYKVEKIENDFVDKSDSISFFKQWIDHVKTLKRNFHVIMNDSNFELSLIGAISKIERKIKDEVKIPLTRRITGKTTNWISPIRAKPKRIYESYIFNKSLDDEYSTDKLKKMLTSKKSESKDALIKDIVSFGEETGLYKGIGVKKFGSGNLSPYEINITLDKQPFKICNVGYGISQILPILAEMIIKPTSSWFLIQQPEIHLHPKAQSYVGELIYNAHIKEENNFIVETHSEYLINRFRMRLKENRSNNPRSQVIFFERTDTGNQVHIIEIQNNGKYSENQPASFSDFFIEEDLKLLEL